MFTPSTAAHRYGVQRQRQRRPETAKRHHHSRVGCTSPGLPCGIDACTSFSDMLSGVLLRLLTQTDTELDNAFLSRQYTSEQ